MSLVENDFSIVGGGIGGCSIGLYLSQKYKTVLFEKEPYLGGCASTFKRKGEFFNAGATTFAGYDKGSILYDYLSKYNIKFEKKKLDFALCVLIGDKTIYRYQDFDRFLQNINSAFPYKENYEFWKLIYEINQEFYSFKGYYYSQKNNLEFLKSLASFKMVFFKYYKYIFSSAKGFIKDFFMDIDDEYLDFLDNQVLIVAQTKLSDANFLTAALALGYHFLSNYYIFGGMGSIFDSMKKNIAQVKLNTKIKMIERQNAQYLLHTKDNIYKSKNIVLNSTVFDSGELFYDKEILSFLDRYKKFDEGVSAFTLYISLNKVHNLNHHYQIIEKENLPHTISNSIFVSLGDKDDKKLSTSITVSIHTKTSLWDSDYKSKKEELSNKILYILKERLNIEHSMIKNIFAGTPYTFKGFINRTSLGGIPLKKENLFFRLPSNETPVKGLYLVGDTSFAAQGWMGVMMGVNNLGKLI